MQKMEATAHQRRCLRRVTAKNCVPEAPEPRTRAVPDSVLFPEKIGAMAVDEEQTKTRVKRDRVEREPRSFVELCVLRLRALTGPNHRSPIPRPNSYQEGPCSAFNRS